MVVHLLASGCCGATSLVFGRIIKQLRSNKSSHHCMLAALTPSVFQRLEFPGSGRTVYFSMSRHTKTDRTSRRQADQAAILPEPH